MKNKISLVMITKNNEDIIGNSLDSAKEIADEIIIVDDYSFDKTRIIAKNFEAKVYLRHLDSLSQQKKWGIKKSKNNWFLPLDSDEVLSVKLKKEIKKIFDKKKINFSAFFIPYQNHFLGRSVKHGGDNYQMIRLFKKKYVFIRNLLLHEKVEIKKGKLGRLVNRINHYSYRSLWQMFKKFTWYGLLEAKQRHQNNEKSSLKKFSYTLFICFMPIFLKTKDIKMVFCGYHWT